jgi:hypothetical protein
MVSWSRIRVNGMVGRKHFYDCPWSPTNKTWELIGTWKTSRQKYVCGEFGESFRSQHTIFINSHNGKKSKTETRGASQLEDALV